ncbi:MAG: hypothetical protein F6J93_32425 [Oscillatoria sp. SIO1A7]|nr:hypothetical protein [Oscillatoria sp. SIO1A7]
MTYRFPALILLGYKKARSLLLLSIANSLQTIHDFQIGIYGGIAEAPRIDGQGFKTEIVGRWRAVPDMGLHKNSVCPLTRVFIVFLL